MILVLTDGTIKILRGLIIPEDYIGRIVSISMI